MLETMKSWRETGLAILITASLAVVPGCRNNDSTDPADTQGQQNQIDRPGSGNSETQVQRPGDLDRWPEVHREPPRYGEELDEYPSREEVAAMTLEEVIEYGLIDEFIRRLEANETVIAQPLTVNDDPPLSAAAGYGRTEIVRILIESGADVNARNVLGVTALHYAARSGHHEICEILIEHGASVQATAPGYSPLIWAVRAFRLDIARLLLEHGADVNFRANTPERQTAMDWAIYNRDSEMVELLREFGADQ